MVFSKFRFFAKLTRCSAGSHMSLVANKSEIIEIFSWDLRWSFYTKNRNLSKIVNYDTFRVDFWQKSSYNWYFPNSNFLPNSQGALRDLTWARLQSNLRLLKNFLELSDEALITKIEIPRKSRITTHLGSISGKNLHIIGIFQILIFCQTHKVLCGISHELGCIQTWVLWKNFFRSQKRLIYQKSKSLGNYELWPIYDEF